MKKLRRRFSRSKESLMMRIDFVDSEMPNSIDMFDVEERCYAYDVVHV